MRTPVSTLAALACAGLLIGAAPAAAKPKPRKTATYQVTFRAVMKESWRFSSDYADDCRLTGVLCTHGEHGEGSASIQLHSRRPYDVMVMRGAAKRPPILNWGTDGMPITGSSLRTGTMTSVYAGPWDAANPDTEESTAGCGNRTVKTFGTVGWSGRNQLMPVVVVSEDRDDCPTGPPEALDWEGGESPSLMDVIARAAQSKFLATMQFTVSGSKAWKGTMSPTSRSDEQGHYFRSGDKTVTWQWEATFRMKGAKKKRR
jgi:hypothetical protein